jgi:hypothetical protein
MSWRRTLPAVFWACIRDDGCLLLRGRRRVTFAYATLRKEGGGWERIPREEQMFLSAVAAWDTD